MGNRSGHAKVKFDNGDEYVGGWENGRRHGYGEYEYGNGNKYAGSYGNGQRHGRGVFTYSDGSRYEGEYSRDKKHGVGIYSYPNGTRYEGHWWEGKKDGAGTHRFASGARYDGEYKDDLMSGRGTYTYQDGDWYSGEWSKDKMHGKGILKQDNQVWEVKHEAGVMIEKKISEEPHDKISTRAIDSTENTLQLLESGSFAGLSSASEKALQVLEIRVLKGRHFPQLDMFGLSDPYVVIQLEEVKKVAAPHQPSADWTSSDKISCKTKTCKRTLNPEWDSLFTFVVCTDTTYRLKLGVWDWDFAKTDDTIGELTFQIAADILDGKPRWYVLEHVARPTPLLKAFSEGPRKQEAASAENVPQRRGSNVGQLKVVGTESNLHRSRSGELEEIQPAHPPSSTRMVPQSGSGLPAEICVSCRLAHAAHWEVMIVEAEHVPKLDMFGKADPYCVVRWGAGSNDHDHDVHWTGGTTFCRHKTSTQRNTLHPTWNEAFLFKANPGQNEQVSISLWDWDLGKYDDYVGAVTIPVDEALRREARRHPLQGVTAWYVLGRDDMHVPSLRSARGSRKRGNDTDAKVKVRIRMIKKGSLEQFVVHDKTKSLLEASETVSGTFELWELEEMCRLWFRNHPSGLVQREEFTKFASDYLHVPVGAEEHIDRMFRLIDQNNDGCLSFTEITLALATLARGSIEEKLTLGFRLNDLNGDGYISGEEVWKAVHVLWLAGGSEDEGNQATSQQHTNALAAQFLEAADKDGDARISLEEYKSVAMQDEVFMSRMQLDSGVVDFNRDPLKGLSKIMRAAKAVSAEDTARLLCTARHISRLSRGELLGAESLEGLEVEFSIDEVRECFFRSQDYSETTIDGAIRKLVNLVHPPLEVENIQRLFIAFAREFANQNKDGIGPQIAYNLVVAIFRLNVNLHNVQGPEPMSKQSFMLMVRELVNNSSQTPAPSVLEEIYTRVKSEEIQMGKRDGMQEVLSDLVSAATLKV